MGFAAEVSARIVAQGVATTAQIGISSNVEVPATGKFITLTETGGVGPYRTHNTGATASYKRPSLQVFVRAPTYDEAMVLALAVYQAITIRDMYLSGTWYLYIEPDAEPADLGRKDDNDRAQVVFNVRALKRPS